MLKVYLIYSNFCNFCKYIVDNIDTIQQPQHNINTICIDNNKLRNKIIKNNIKYVPSLIIFNNNHKTVYVGSNAISYIKNKLKESNKEKHTLEKYKIINDSLKTKLKQKKSKLQNVLQLIHNQEIEEQELVAIQVEEDLKTLFPSEQIQKSLTTDHRAGNLVHLCTYFQFPKLQKNLLEVANTLHPTPAVGGVPKKKAQEFIFANEPHDRSFYTGFLGPTNAFETQLFVNLRCASWTKKTTTLYIGAGITLESDPEKEWLETQRKAKTLASVL